MSFALTTPQILARTKTVTRRLGWTFLKPGDLIQAIEKGQGLKKGEKVRKLAVLRVVDVSRGPLKYGLTLSPNGTVWARQEVVREGFTEMNFWHFEEFFCRTHKGCTRETEVTRIEFEYVDQLTDADLIRLIRADHHRANIGHHEDDPEAVVQWDKAWVDPGGSIFAPCPYLKVPVYQPGWSEPGWDPVRRVYPSKRVQRIIEQVGYEPTPQPAALS